MFIPDFTLIRRDRDRHGGGVAIYTHVSTPFSIRSKHPDIELLLIDLKLKRSTLTCGLFYRPPSSDPTALSCLESSLEELPRSLSESLLLIGDFNVDLLKSSDPILTSITNKLNLTQVVSSPTRTSPSSTTLIDHTYTSSGLKHASYFILPPSALINCFKSQGHYVRWLSKWSDILRI